MRYLRTNTDTRITVGPFLDKTTGIDPEVALTVTSEKLTFVVDTAGVPTLILDVAPTASGGANDMVHITGDDSGYYDLELAAANVNYLGRAMLSLNDVATHLPVFHEFMILPAVIYDAMILGTDLFDVSVTQLLGTAWLTPAVAGTPDVNVKTETDHDLTTTQKASVTAAVPTVVQIQTGLATPTNITAGTITTVTNLTNAPTVGDFNATMKTSLNAATPASVVGAVGSVTGNVGGNVTGSVGSLATQAKADVNAEVLDVLNVDTFAEPGQEIPPATTTLVKKIGYLFKLLRNKITTTSTQINIFADDAITVDQKSTISDDATTFTRGEFGSGP